ncbi:MAG: methyltransferase family protein [Candidatus Thorarchaeota archaeon]
MVEDQKTKTSRIRNWFFGVVGHLVILLQITPALWMGLMTAPLIAMLIVFLVGGVVPSSTDFIVSLFISPTIYTVILDLGLFIWISSVFYLFWKKRAGLVTTGIYKYVRHPQYLGVILFTSSLTAASWFILSVTFGIGYTSKEITVLLWFLMVLIYVALAFGEEHYLSQSLGDEYDEYRQNTALMFPFLKTSNRILDLLIVVIISGALVWIQVTALFAYVFGVLF